MEKKYVFDLDNTLVYTNLLNNDSYNYALSTAGLPRIDNIERITRQVVFEKCPNMSRTVRNEILRVKQEYFKKNLHTIVPNTTLLKMLALQKKEDCILWTSADCKRVKEVLRFYDLEEEFVGVIFGEKQNIALELEEICKIFKCKLGQIIFYEDNKEVIRKLIELKANVVEI